MAIITKDELLTKKRPLLQRFVVQEGRPWRECLVSSRFWATLILALVLWSFAYQFTFTKVFDLDSPRDRPYLVDYYATERYQHFVYRWVKPSSNIVLDGVGQLPKAKVRLEISARPTNAPPATVHVAFNSEPVATFVVNQPRQTYEFEYSFPNRSLTSAFKSSELNIWLTMDSFQVKGDPRELGVVVSQIEIVGGGLWDTGRPVLPDLPLLLALWGSSALLFVLCRRAGWSLLLCAAWTTGLVVLLAVGIVLDRATLALAVPLLLEAMVLAYPLTVLGLIFVQRCLQGQIELTSALRWLALIFAAAFVLRAVGINHPSFQTLDHGFRIHEIAAIKDDPSVLFSRYYNINTYQPVNGQDGRSIVAGQWQLQVSVPYSPLFYILALPIAYLTNNSEHDLLHWTNLLAVWLDASGLFFLYIIARYTLGRLGHIAGLVGAVGLLFFPLSFLMVSDGGYNTILATWLTLAWLVAFTGLSPFVSGSYIWQGRKKIIGVGLLLGLAFLAHSATLLITGTMFLLFLGLLLVWRETRVWAMWRSFVSIFGIGLVFSFALYYGFYVWPIIQTTLPTIGSHLLQGQTIGKQVKHLDDNFWVELFDYFHFVPFVATLAVIFGMTISWIRRRTRPISTLLTAPSLVLYITWFVTFAIFSGLAVQINLLQKQMLFVIPLFALGLGLAVSWIVDWTTTSTQPKVLVRWLPFALITTCVVWFVATGAYTWYIRAINYVLPKGSG